MAHVLRIRESLLPDFNDDEGGNGPSVGGSGVKRAKATRTGNTPALGPMHGASAAAASAVAATPASAPDAHSADSSMWSAASISSPVSSAAGSGGASRREQRYLDAQLTLAHLTSSPPPAAAASPAAPAALPVSLLAFHRAFQSSGWKLALATPEDRYSGRHVCTSLFALLWLKTPAHVLNHSADRHWLRKVRHIVAARHAASIAGPHSTGAQAEMPPLNDEAEFSLAHALHLPHTIIYSQDDADRGREDDPLRIRLSSFPTHIWQPTSTAAASTTTDQLAAFASAASSSAAPFSDGWIRPSVWYFSRHAFQGQHEILRKNKPLHRREHLDAVRAAFLRGHRSATGGNNGGGNGGGGGGGKNQRGKSPAKSRPGSAVRSIVGSSRPGTAQSRAPPGAPSASPSTWRDAAPARLQQQQGQGYDQTVVAQYTSLDPERGTHISFLTARDLEQFLEAAVVSGGGGGGGQAASPAQSRPGTASVSGSNSDLSSRARKDRLRQALYDDLYNEMDLIPPPAAPGAPLLEPVAAAGTRARRPASASHGASGSSAASAGSTADPLALHPHQAPVASQFRGRKLVAMLQQFVPPPGEHAELLRVEWREEAAASWEGRTAVLARNRAARLQREQRRAERRARAYDDGGNVNGGLSTPARDGECKDPSSDPAAAAAASAWNDRHEEEADEAERIRDDEEMQVLQQSPEKRTVCYISRLLNAHPLRGTATAGAGTGARSGSSPSLYQRLCCFSYLDSDPPAVLDSPVMQGVLYTRLSYVTDLIALHVRAISGNNLSPQHMSLLFQIDANHDLHLLWSDRVVYWHEKALLRGPGARAEARMAREYVERIEKDREEKRVRRMRREQKKAEREERERDEAMEAERAAAEAVKEASIAAILAAESSTPTLQSSSPCSPPRPVLDVFEYDADFFSRIPSPSSCSVTMGHVLRGWYHKVARARSHLMSGDEAHSLKEEVVYEPPRDREQERLPWEGDEAEEERERERERLRSQPRGAARQRQRQRLNRAGTPAIARPHSRGGGGTVSASPSMATLAESPHESEDEEEEDEEDEEVAEQHGAVHEPASNPEPAEGKQTVAADVAPISVPTPAPASSSQHASPSPSPDDDAGVSSSDNSDLEGIDDDEDGVDGLTALLNRKLRVVASAGADGSPVAEEKHSEWADEILFSFARKRAQERKHFRRQEEAYLEEKAARQQSMFGGRSGPTSPTEASRAAHAAGAGWISARPTTAGSAGGRSHRSGGAGGQQQQQQGINLLEAGAPGSPGISGIPAHLLASRSFPRVSSPAGAYILAQAQRNGVLGGPPPLHLAALSDAAVPGARGLRNQLANTASLELTPSASKSGWESRGSAAAAAAASSTTAGARDAGQANAGKVESLNFRMRQVTLLAAAVAADPSLAAPAAGGSSVAGGGGSVGGPRSHFAHRMRAELASGGSTRPMRSSASLTALAASMHNSNAKMTRSASSTSFAPPPPPPREDATARFEDDESGEEDEEEEGGEGHGAGATDGPDGTFMTSTTLSPRGLASRARMPAPLRPPPRPATASASATRVTLDELPRTSAELSAPAGYFTCPRCRLSLQIHAVHSTLLLDVLAEWERMGAFVRAHQSSFEQELSRGRKGGTGRQARALAEYMDLTYHTDAGSGPGSGGHVPPAIAFVFPSLTAEQFESLRTDPAFLRSTIDLCGDCHALVRVPLHPGSGGEERTELHPLELHEELLQHGRIPPQRFCNPGSESMAPGLSHASTLTRQTLRANDQAVEEEAFHAGEEEAAVVRSSLRAGEVDPHAAGAGVVPLDIRRLNQSTMELLATIPYNALELDEFERKKIAAAGGAAKERSDAVAAVLDRFRTKKGATAHGADGGGGGEEAGHHGGGGGTAGVSQKRRQIQQQLLLSAGLVSPAPSVPVRPARTVSAQEFVPNPFMPPRVGGESTNTQSAPSSSAKKLQHSGSSSSVAKAERVGSSFAEREAARRARRAAQLEADMSSPAALMSRYDPALLSRLGGVVSGANGPIHDAALVQSQQRKARTTEVVGEIIARSVAERQRETLAAQALRWDAPAEVAMAHSQLVRPTFLQRFSQHHASKTSQFAPLYAQLTRAKPVAPRTVDHVALSLQAKARARAAQGRFSGRAPPAGRADSDMGGSHTERTEAAGQRSVVSPGARVASAQHARSRVDSSSSPSRAAALPSATPASFTPLSTSYAVVSPSPYAPHLLTVANTRGQVHTAPLPVGVPIIT